LALTKSLRDDSLTNHLCDCQWEDIRSMCYSNVRR